MPPHLLQINNIGNIIGGTAACAWTITRSLPHFRHTVAFLGRISPETRQAFAHCELKQWSRVTRQEVAAIHPEVILLHNTSPSRCESHLPAPTILYRHSTARPATANVTLYCSNWLASRCGGNPQQVLHQAVPRPLPPNDIHDTRPLRKQITIGRICTPTSQKWPPTLIDFYTNLANTIHSPSPACGFADITPSIHWEFTGCPASLQPRLTEALRGRTTFHPASWHARTRLWNWDALLYHNPQVTESFGRTVAEAMRAGCIPIVDNRGGFREQITSDSGYLCGETKDFAQAITELQTAAKRWKMSQAASAHANKNFSLARFAKQLQARFQHAITAFNAR